MAKKQSEEEVIEEVILNDGARDKVQDFLDQYKKPVGGAVLGIFVAVLLGWGYMAFIKKPKEKNAQVQIIRAQQYFEMDSFNLALNGDGQYLGFEAIIDQFGGTKAGMGARLYAGISALNTGDFQKAVDHLDRFKTSDALLNARKYGCLADAYAELDNMDAALSNYQKAVKAAPDNEIVTPVYLLRLAKVQEIQGKNEDAIASYKQLSDNFPESMEGKAAEKELARLEAKAL
jgi:tetratricopeptide (TPR) repeat protein